MARSFELAKNALRVAVRRVARITTARAPMMFPTYSSQIARYVERCHDDVRYATMALAIERLRRDQIEGAFAELGVYRGATSAFLRSVAPERRLFLFDTFQGFPRHLVNESGDCRFEDTSQETVARAIGDLSNVEFRKGCFPDSTNGLESQSFAFVLLDFDLYASAVEALDFFYPRMVRGSYFFMHDFNSPESDHAISRAAREFLADKPELLVEIPDCWGSAVFRKVS